MPPSLERAIPSDRAERPCAAMPWGRVGGVFRWLLPCLLLLTSACDAPPPIREYSIRTDLPAALSGDDRMLGLIVPQPQESWFFKVVGPADAIRFAEQPIRDFLGQLRFADGKPQWSELPAGWTAGVDRPMRFATLLIDTPTRELELAISQLPRSGEWDDQVAQNVNRWRGQMSLENSTDRWAGAEAFTLASLTDTTAAPAWVDLSGRMGAGPSAMAAMPPMPPGGAAGAPPTSTTPPAPTPPATTASSPAPAAGAKPDGLKYDAPPEWRAGKMSMMRMAAFDLGPAEKSAELTIIQAGGDLRGNVDRWLGQVLGQPPAADVVDAALQAAVPLSVSGRDAQRFYLNGSDPAAADGQAIDATIVPLDNGMSLFIKATGPAATLLEERDRIGKFMESISLAE
jgi:hypothetical protein